MEKIIAEHNKHKALLEEVVQARCKCRGETYFFFHTGLQDACWGNNDELREQMKIWRKERKEGVLELKEANNRTIKINGQEWYILVVQRIGYNGIDILGFGFDKILIVSGNTICFKHLQNRDATYKYVMGL